MTLKQNIVVLKVEIILAAILLAVFTAGIICVKAEINRRDEMFKQCMAYAQPEFICYGLTKGGF